MAWRVTVRLAASPRAGLHHRGRPGRSRLAARPGHGRVQARRPSCTAPPDWFAVGFDDGDWQEAREYREEEIDPKQPYYDADFSEARFIWTDDVKLDNVVVFRHVVPAPPDGKTRPDFSNLNDVVPQGPPKGGGRRPPGGRPR